MLVLLMLLCIIITIHMMCLIIKTSEYLVAQAPRTAVEESVSETTKDRQVLVPMHLALQKWLDEYIEFHQHQLANPTTKTSRYDSRHYTVM